MLLDKRLTFKPFEYPELESFYEKIQKTYWIHNSIDFSADVQHFKTELNEKERYIVATILKSFTQAELIVMDDFWANIGRYLPKPEVQILAITFAENEARHSVAYSRLNDVLNIQNFDAFLEDPVLIERFNNLRGGIDPGNFSAGDVMRQLALFGCFTEFVNLFSQFAILKSFSANGRALLPNIGTVIDYSAMDEDCHARAAMWLVNKLKSEYPAEWTSEIKNRIRQAAHVTFEIERKLIDQIFVMGDLPNLTKHELLNFMKARINEAMFIIDLPLVFEDVDREAIKSMSWFLDNIFAKQHSDFFYRKPTSYTKNHKNFSASSVFLTKQDIDAI